MREFVSLFILFSLFVGWIVAEVYADKMLRIVLGLFCMAVFFGGLVSANKRAAHLDAVHAACFREMERLLDTGDVDTVKRAVSTYQSSDRDEHPAHEALHVLAPVPSP